VKSIDPLLAAWETVLERKAPAPAIFDPAGQVLRTFREIEMGARDFDSQLQGRAKGELVAIDLGNHPDWPAMLLATLRRGLIALPLDESTTGQQRVGALEISSGPKEANPGERPAALLKLTSGTTSAPRAIRFRSEQLLADCEQICETMGITEDDVNFAVIPVSHSYGFSNLITPLIARGVPLVLSRDRMPRAVLDDLARSGATIFPGMPVFFQTFVQMESVPDLPRLRLCISAGAPLPLSVAQKFRAQFGQSIHSFYGSSECGGICYDREARLEEAGFVGQPMQGVSVRMLDPECAMSRIEVRSRAAGDGYVPTADAEKLSSGRFVPDDLLVATETGYRIAGRVSDVINVAGRKVNPAEVEAVLLAFEGIRAAVVFGRGSALRNEEVVACIVTETHFTEPELLDYCRRRLSGWQVPKRIFFLEKIPVTERGKISRRALGEQFAD
jgi:acyl-CoA synthetase (AMP-forming)/AMP-acid ligase II